MSTEQTQLSMKDNSYNVVCLKHGDLYSPDYVNILYNMVKRYCTYPIRFHCLTEDPAGINPDINIIPLPDIGVQGWWYKPYLFSSELPIKGVILYFDLDVVITANIDKLFEYQPGKFLICQDFIRKQIGPTPKFNSSVMRFHKSKVSYIYRRFVENSSFYINRMQGDQNFIYAVAGNTGKHFPHDWIQSWKWEIRKSGRLDYNMPIGRRKLIKIEDTKPPSECCVAVFHGDPKPHRCEDPYIIENWR